MNYIIKTTKLTDDFEVEKKILSALESYTTYYRIDLLYELIEDIGNDISFSLGLEEVTIKIENEKQRNEIRNFLQKKLDEYTTELEIDTIIGFFKIGQSECKKDGNKCDEKTCSYKEICDQGIEIANTDIPKLRDSLYKLYKRRQYGSN